MNPEAAFLQAILDEPRDDAARLVYADWLEDRGDARGELIRVQCRLAAWEPDLERRTELQRREAELLAAHADSWLGPLGADCTHFEFQRGLARLTLPAQRFLRRRSAKRTLDLFQRVGVESVRFLVTGISSSALAGAGSLEAITDLDLSGNKLNDDFLAAFAESPHLTRLTRLDLSNNLSTDTGVRALIESPVWPRLSWLELQGNDIVDGLFAQDALLLPTGHLVNSLGMRFALIPAGTFLMGSPESEATRKPDEGPQRPITLTRPFYLGVYSVTQREYELVMGENRSEFTAANGGGASHPVEKVNWEDAVAFCQRLSEMPEEKAAGRFYRLPTEAEWEHACRAGSTTPFHYGGSLSSLEANFHGAWPYFGRRGLCLDRTTPVGSYRPNDFGLYDMHGNVWEWCQDWYSARYLRDAAARDPLGPEKGTHRSQRGGCWGAYGECCRSAYRGSNDPPGRRLNCVGMRVALTV